MNPQELAAILHRPGTRLHLIGVGGIGMVGLAQLLLADSRTLSGSDLATGPLTEALGNKGLRVHLGHRSENLSPETDLVIRSSAVPASNPEWLAAIEHNIPVVRRGEALAAFLSRRELIAVCGTHGKTTTTAMIAHLFRSASAEIGWYVGGESKLLGAVARDADRIVAECDESDGTLVHYHPAVTVITNIEFDHMETFAREEDFLASFTRVAQQSSQLLTSADPVAERLAGQPGVQISNLHLKADHSTFDHGDWQQLKLGVGGRHNVENAILAVSVARQFGLAESDVRKGLSSFQHVGRRFEDVYHQGGIRIINDYAHHPTEVIAVVKTSQHLQPKRLLAVFQPHRYSRTLALRQDFPASFEGVEKLWLLPVYPASEAPIDGGTSVDLHQEFQRQGQTCHYIESMQEAWSTIRAELRSGDLLLILGAGDVLQMAAWAAKADNN